MAFNEYLYPPQTQDILNVFVAADLLSHSPSDSAKYKPAWLNAKLIRSLILSAGECPDACSRAFSIAPNNKEIESDRIQDSL